MADVGIPMPDDECARRWRPWTPNEVDERLAGVDVPWGAVAGWAVDLFLGTVTRDHDDIEIAVPAGGFATIAAALRGFDWDVIGDGRRWPYPATMDRYRQTWLRDPHSGDYHLDVFREPHDGATWIYRRDRTITMPYESVYARTADAVPYLIPELVLLFKAGTVRAKDQADFDRVLPALDTARRTRLRGWLHRLDRQHRWLVPLG